jgi:hypothetical protein
VAPSYEQRLGDIERCRLRWALSFLLTNPRITAGKERSRRRGERLRTSAPIEPSREEKEHVPKPTHLNLDSHDLRRPPGVRRGGSDQTHASTAASINRREEHE